jgi:LexA-binding, inner membrane-associated putative hydrolase
MFIGHFAVAFAAKPLAPRTSLGTLVLAAQLLDLIWPVLVLVGIETVRIEPQANPFLRLRFVHYPWTHSLLLAFAWAVAFALLYGGLTGYRRGALTGAALVFSHWVLDWVTHRPDLPLAPGLETRIGLGLWNWPAATIAVEAAMFAVGVALYTRSTAARNRAGSLGFWSFVALLLVGYAASMGSPPPSATALASGALAMWLFVAWATWFDRNRTPTVAEVAPAAAEP